MQLDSFEVIGGQPLKGELQLKVLKTKPCRSSCPGNSGDWYFSGRYPTPGGNRVANRAFMNFMENVDARAY